MPRHSKDKRPDFRRAYEAAAREARAKGFEEEAHILEAKANQLGVHIAMYPELRMQPSR